MAEKSNYTPPVSVLIPTRDRAEDLARCLPTVLENDYPDFEVIVIDQTDGDSNEIVTKALKDDRIYYYRQTGAVGKTRALNFGLTKARGEIIAFTDDDCTVPTDWVSRAVQILASEPGAGVLFSSALPVDHDSRDSYVAGFQPKSYRRLKGSLERAMCQGLAGPNMAIRREVFDRLGGFDECLGAGCRFRSGDDDDLAYRAMRAGFDVILEPTNAVVHWAKRTYANGAGQRLLRNHFYGCGAFLAKHVRSGDPVAVYALARVGWKECLYIMSSLWRQHRPSGAGRLAFLFLGVARGLLQPLNRKQWLYKPTYPEPDQMRV